MTFFKRIFIYFIYLPMGNSEALGLFTGKPPAMEAILLSHMLVLFAWRKAT